MIDYKILDDSVRFYESEGFVRIESPWTVTRAISAITAPSTGTYFTINEKNKVLVASAEQSFLYLYNKGFLPKGKFQSITPCFRDEPFDSLHTKYFIKNELIVTDDVSEEKLHEVINQAVKFFESKLQSSVSVTTIIKGRSYDIVYHPLGDAIELGSYGIRSCDFLTWIYGTGVAEPRLSSVMKKYGIS